MMMRLTCNVFRSLRKLRLVASDYRIIDGHNATTCTCIKKEIKFTPNCTAIRCLYTPTTLGIDKFLFHKLKWQNKFTLSKETYLHKMRELCQKEEGMYSIYSEDLRNMMYLCEKNKQDLELLLQMAKTFYAAEKKKLAFDFSYGVEYMRLCHHFNLPNEARKVLNDEELSGFFKQVISYVIAMTLFYNCGQYQEVLNTMHKVVTEKLFLRPLLKSPFILTMAACYKLNSPGSLEEALAFVKKWDDANINFTSRALSFASALSLQQNKPFVALELSSKTPWNYFLLKNLKAIALVQVGRAEDALPILRGYSGGYEHLSLHEEQDNVIFMQTMSTVEKALMNENKTEALLEFNTIKERLIDRNLIMNKSLDEALCEPMSLEEHKKKFYIKGVSNKKKKNEMFAASFERGRKTETIEKSFKRTGFNDVK